jgi:hypothetical protein
VTARQGPVGADPVGAEALRLLHAAQDWARGRSGAHDWSGADGWPGARGWSEGGGVPGDSGGCADAGPEVPASGAGECRSCPVCRLISVLRGDRPEVTEKLAEAGTALLAALRAALGPVATGTAPEPAARVQRIDLD